MPRWIPVVVMVAASALVAPVGSRVVGAVSSPQVSTEVLGALTANIRTADRRPSQPSGSRREEKNNATPKKLHEGEEVGKESALRSIAAALCGYKQATIDQATGQCDASSLRGAQVLIAIVPDPVHTHLALRFDRVIDQIEDSLQRMDWIYDRSWLPWDNTTRKEAERWESRALDAKEKDAVESMPGVLMFRPKNKPPHSESTDKDELIVFVVGDKPTSGINTGQFEQALDFWQKISNANSACVPQNSPSRPIPTTLMVLGPSFSGSLPSLDTALRHRFAHSHSSRCSMPFIRVLSGTVSDGEGLYSLSRDYPSGAQSPQVASFYPDAKSSTRLLKDYISSKYRAPLKIAHVSEKESSFGGLAAGEITDRFHYPREVSQLRRAYQQNGIIGYADAANGPRSELQIPFASGEGDGDSVQTFAGTAEAVSLEADLTATTRALVAGDYSVALLSGTDVMDEIFVARYFSQHAPNLTLIIQDTDQLFLHQGTDLSLNNVYVASSWPLIEQNQAWSGTIRSDPGQAVQFASASNEGVAAALRTMLCSPVTEPAVRTSHCDGGEMLEYRSPFKRIDQGDTAERPPIWLSLVEHGSFLPVALLKETAQDQTLGNGLNLPEAADSGQVRAAGITRRAGLPERLLACTIIGLLLWHGWACFHCRLDRSAAWTYALAESQHHVLRLLVKSSLSMLGGFALAVLFVPDCPGLSVQSGLFRAGLVLGQVSAAGISALSVYKVFTFYDTRGSSLWAGLYALTCAMSLCIADYTLWPLLAPREFSERVFFLYRASQPFSGGSPAMPLLMMIAAATLVVYTLFSRLAFFGHRIPVLPNGYDELRCPSNKSLDPLTKLLADVCDKRRWYAALICVVVAPSVLLISRHHSVSFLAHSGFDWVLTAGMVLVGASILQNLYIASEAWRLLKHKLLIPLKQSPLRWGFTWIKGFSWQRIWTSSKTLSSNQVFDALVGLLQASSRRALSGTEAKFYGEICDLYQAKQSESWSQDFSVGMQTLHFRMQGEAQNRLSNLENEWLTDRGPLTGTEESRGLKGSLSIGEAKENDRAEIAERMGNEEFVALLYVGYIRMVLIQIRHRVLTAAVLYILLLWALTSYPWMYRHTILLLLISVFAVLAATTVQIYSGMHRDDILSRTTETVTGKLDGGFLPRVLAVLGIPLLTLVVSQFPEASNLVFSWLEPSLSKLP